jgi:hypothetical protein
VKPHFDSDSDGALLDDGPRSAVRISEFQVLELAGRHLNAMLRQGNEAEHSGPAQIVDPATEAGEVDRARRSGIDGGRNPCREARCVGVTAPRIDSPVAVNVEINQAGRNDVAAGIDDPRRRLPAELCADRRDSVPGDPDIGWCGEARTGIDHMAATDEQVEVGHEHSNYLTLVGAGSFRRELLPRIIAMSKGWQLGRSRRGGDPMSVHEPGQPRTQRIDALHCECTWAFGLSTTWTRACTQRIQKSNAEG